VGGWLINTQPLGDDEPTEAEWPLLDYPHNRCPVLDLGDLHHPLKGNGRVTWALDAVVALLGFDAELVANADGGPAAVRAQAAYLLGSIPTEGS
jgi:hypothetical protein